MKLARAIDFGKPFARAIKHSGNKLGVRQAFIVDRKHVNPGLLDANLIGARQLRAVYREFLWYFEPGINTTVPFSGVHNLRSTWNAIGATIEARLEELLASYPSLRTILVR